jgi:hypothetical protein
MSTFTPDRRARLRIVTFDHRPHEHAISVPMAVACDGTMICRCEDCALERAEAVARGVRATRGNPLVPRPARQAA